MKKRLHFSNVLALFLCAVGAGFVFRLVLHHQAASSTGSAVRSLFALCARAEVPFDYDCLRRGMLPLVTEDTLMDVLGVLQDVFAQPNVSLKTHGALTCHPSGHVAGEIAVEKGIEFSRVSTLCGAICDYGCVHGALVATLRHDHEFLAKVGSLCDAFRASETVRQMSACGHAVGHGLAEVFASDFPNALAYCDKFQNESVRSACGQGSMMEHLIGLPDRPKNMNLLLDDILSFCGGLAGRYKEECFDNVGTYAGHVTQDVFEAKNICTRVPSSSRMKCVQSLGGVVYYQFQHSPLALSAYCTSMGDAASLACILGAIDTSVGESRSMEYGRILCEQMRGTTQKRCFAYYGTQVASSWGSAVQKEKCSQLNNENASACNSGKDSL